MAQKAQHSPEPATDPTVTGAFADKRKRGRGFKEAHRGSAEAVHGGTSVVDAIDVDSGEGGSPYRGQGRGYTRGESSGYSSRDRGQAGAAASAEERVRDAPDVNVGRLPPSHQPAQGSLLVVADTQQCYSQKPSHDRRQKGGKGNRNEPKAQQQRGGRGKKAPLETNAPLPSAGEPGAAPIPLPPAVVPQCDDQQSQSLHNEKGRQKEKSKKANKGRKREDGHTQARYQPVAQLTDQTSHVAAEVSAPPVTAEVKSTPAVPPSSSPALHSRQGNPKTSRKGRGREPRTLNPPEQPKIPEPPKPEVKQASEPVPRAKGAKVIRRYILVQP